MTLHSFKTHYYGGIKKYQWGSMPLAMHGVVVKKDGTTVEITIGEDPSDPVLYITDLLIHLSKQQMQRPLSEGLRGEELNIVLGTTPYPDEDVKEPFRLEVLRYLNEKYGITERDFARAEIEFVPAAKPRDIGLDRSLVGGYGQDDRVCAYAALMAQLATENPEYTTVTILTDKEEIGSNGNTGSESNFLYDYIGYLAQAEGVGSQGCARAFGLPLCGCERRLRPDLCGCVRGEELELLKPRRGAHEVHRFRR